MYPFQKPKSFIKNDANMRVVTFLLSRVPGLPGSGASESGLATLLRPGEVEDRNEEERVAVEKVMSALLFSEDLVRLIAAWFDGSGVPWLAWPM